MTSQSILFLAVILVGLAWSRGVRKAASIEYPTDDGKMLIYALLASVTFMTLVLANVAIGISGVIAKFDQLPPPFLFYFLSIFGISFAIAFSPFGTILAKNLSYSQLVGFHSFRVLAELLIYLGVQEGVAPKQISIEGYNYDIVTALTAIVVAFYVRNRFAPKLVLAWNILGTAALIVIAFIAATSMPTPLRLFMSEPSNIWVTRFPYILLPGILVVAAIAGHLILYRKLGADLKN